MSPDWAGSPEAVPYSTLDDPQSLNLYSYVRSNPLSKADPDGHSPDWWQKLQNWLIYGQRVTNANLNAALKDEAAKDLQILEKEDAAINGQPAGDALAGKTNKEIVDAFGEFQVDVFNGNVGRIDVPGTPGGMSSSDFGNKVMKWGRSSDAARQRMTTLTREELENSSVTKEIAKEWRDFYRNEVARNPNNPSAKGRAELMHKAYEILGGK